MLNRIVTAYVTPFFWLDERVNLPDPARAVLGLPLVPVLVLGLVWASTKVTS